MLGDEYHSPPIKTTTTTIKCTNLTLILNYLPSLYSNTFIFDNGLKKGKAR